MIQRKLKKRLGKLTRILVIAILCAGTGINVPADNSLAAASKCTEHNYIIQQTAVPGSGKTTKVCQECGDTQEMTIPASINSIAWIKDNVNSNSPETHSICDKGEQIEIYVSCNPSDVDNKEFVVEVSDTSVAVPSAREGYAGVLTITGSGELTVNVHAKYDPSIEQTFTFTIKDIPEGAVNYGTQKGYTGLDAQYHTKEEIRNYYLKHPNYNLEPEYKVKPLLEAPYTIGELTEEAKQDALNLLNIYRYITGVPEVSITEKAQNYAQAAASFFALTDYRSHVLSMADKPKDMSKEIFKQAYYGAWNSNIASSMKLSETIVAYMLESEKDYNDFGHRMQLLKYNYKEAGFGIARSKSGCLHSATYVNAYMSKNKIISYPGQNQPLEYFGNNYAWTIVFPEESYKTKINVKLTDMKTGQTWNYKNGSDGFYIDTNSGGGGTCVIFFPKDIEYKEGDCYKVEINGIPNPISYQVNMFYLADGDSIEKADVGLFMPAGSCTYIGEEQKPPVKYVKLGTVPLKEGRDYTVEYQNNVNIGIAAVKVTGKGRYTGTATKDFKIDTYNGLRFNVGGFVYTVTGKDEVSCTGFVSKKIKKVKIPETVKIGGKDFVVTSIGISAFTSEDIKSVNIGSNVKKIGKCAFEFCYKLKEITLGSGIEEIGKNAFKGINQKAVINLPAGQFSKYKNLLKNTGQGKKVKINKI